MALPVRRPPNHKGTARAGVRAARGAAKEDKLAAAQAAYKQALEQQAATGEILSVIAKAGNKSEAVFEAITRAAMRLIPNARVALLLARDGELHYMWQSGISAAARARNAKA